jgi:tetratricopeptide (TPR) repeat protein
VEDREDQREPARGIVGEEHLATDFLLGGADRVLPRVRGVRLESRIGEGAFGVVWKGEQFDPIVRTVAVKILRLGSLGSHAAKRFEAEKIALARLEHPHIAHILDAGTTQDGAPYLVMDFIEGVPLDLWCHSHRENLRAIAEMFVRVARAIGYAHRQGILHRDLKPANVLVRNGSGEGAVAEPCVIDFGVAKLVGFDAMRTETMQRPTAATPAYMSPEIASGQAEIDARVDVWSLGVMLSEALVGARPFATERTGMAGALDLQRQITQGRAMRPSDSLARGASRELRSALEDDLDWIVLRALERDPARRYLTPDALADDLERWLAGQPVSARPPSAAYRVRKFMRRNRAAVLAIGGGSLALVVGMAGLVAGWVESNRQVERWREIAALNRSMLTAIDPAVAQGLDPKLVRLVLDEAISELERRPRDEVVEAEIRFTVGSALAATGAFEEAIPHFERVRALRSAGRVDSDAGVREIDNALGAALVEAGRLDEGEASLERASRGTDGIAANALHNLAALARMRGELEDAERLLRAALAMKQNDSAVAPISLLATEQELALVLAQQGRYREAEPLARRVQRAKLASLGPRHPDTLRAANNLAEALLSLGEVAEARELAAGCVPLLEEVLGASHPDTLSARNNLAGALRESGELADAVSLYEQNLAVFNSSRSVDDPRAILARANLAHCLNLASRAAEAEREFRETADRALRALGPQHRITLANDANFAAFLVSHARAAEAAVLLDRVLPMLERATGAMHPQSIAARITLARARLALEQPARATEALEPVVRTVLAQAKSNDQIVPLGTLERRALEITRDAMAAEGASQTQQWRDTIDEINRTLAASTARGAG